MLTADAFTPSPGEMERIHAGRGIRPENGGKGGHTAETARNGDSFPEMLESMQDGATDKAVRDGDAFPVHPDGGTVDADRRSALKIKGNGRKTGGLPAPEGKGRGRTAAGDVSAEHTALAAVLFASPRTEAVVAAELDPSGDIRASGKKSPEDGGADSTDVSGVSFAAGSKTRTARGGVEPSLAETPASIGAAQGSSASSGMPAEAVRVPAGKDRGDGVDSLRSPRVEKGSAQKSAEDAPPAAAVSGGPVSASEEKNAGSRDAVVSIVDLRRRQVGKTEGEARGAASSAADADVEMHMHLNSPASFDSEALSNGRFDGADFTGADGGLRHEGGGVAFSGASFSGGAEGASNAGASFSQRLSAEIQAYAQDFVRAGQIVLRNGTEGVIRLTLHPETLGAVRIHLEMSGDKKLSGKIAVSSQDAWDAFEGGMDSLVRSFAEEGFDTAGFDLSWADGGSGGQNADGKISAPFYASRIPDVMASDKTSDNESVREGSPHSGFLYAVDVFA